MTPLMQELGPQEYERLARAWLSVKPHERTITTEEPMLHKRPCRYDLNAASRHRDSRRRRRQLRAWLRGIVAFRLPDLMP
jgi:hypothetical protein